MKTLITKLRRDSRLLSTKDRMTFIESFNTMAMDFLFYPFKATVHVCNALRYNLIHRFKSLPHSV